MDLLEKISNAKTEEEVKNLVEKAIEEKNNNAHKIEELGMVSVLNGSKPYLGFIPFDTRIKYNNFAMETYSMNTTDFIYGFADFIKKQNINKTGMMIASMETYINSYFGLHHKNSREEIFNSKAWNSTETDEEYFQALENNSIGDLKGQNAAECTERAALAQQLLSVFGLDSYYCIGCVKTERKEEAHAFNVVKSKNGYVLLDYSMPVTCYDKDNNPKIFFPFMGVMNDEEFEEFIRGGNLKEFNDYEFINTNNKVSNGKKRIYVANQYKITKENTDMK